MRQIKTRPPTSDHLSPSLCLTQRHMYAQTGFRFSQNAAHTKPSLHLSPVCGMAFQTLHHVSNKT